MLECYVIMFLLQDSSKSKLVFARSWKINKIFCNNSVVLNSLFIYMLTQHSKYQLSSKHEQRDKTKMYTQISRKKQHIITTTTVIFSVDNSCVWEGTNHNCIREIMKRYHSVQMHFSSSLLPRI